MLTHSLTQRLPANRVLSRNKLAELYTLTHSLTQGLPANRVLSRNKLSEHRKNMAVTHGMRDLVVGISKTVGVDAPPDAHRPASCASLTTSRGLNSAAAASQDGDGAEADNAVSVSNNAVRITIRITIVRNSSIVIY